MPSHIETSAPSIRWVFGALSIYDRRLFGDPASEELRQFIERTFALNDVHSIEINHRRNLAIIRFPLTSSPREVLGELVLALKGSHTSTVSQQVRDLLAVASGRRRLTHIYRSNGTLIMAVSGMRRALYLALAGASFGMSAIGIAVPGIPTVPFVILTSYFLVRSSPALNERLLRSRLLGPLLRDWQAYGAVRPAVKWISVGVTLVILTISVSLIELPGPILVVIPIMAALGIWLIVRLPTLHVGGTDMPATAGLLPAGAA